MSADKTRIGLVGFGYIGRYLYEQIHQRPELGLEIGFVHNRGRRRLDDLKDESILDDLDGFDERRVDLVVEVAHPDVTRRYGEAFLDRVDYMPLSLTALADPDIEKSLRQTARDRGTTTFHMMGTCRMGPEGDRTAVLDAELKVRGVQGLRVADASIFPTMPSARKSKRPCAVSQPAWPQPTTAKPRSTTSASSCP